LIGFVCCNLIWSRVDRYAQWRPRPASHSEPPNGGWRGTAGSGWAALARKRRADAGKRRVVSPDLKEIIEGLARQKRPLPLATLHRQVQRIAEQRGKKAPDRAEALGHRDCSGAWGEPCDDLSIDTSSPAITRSVLAHNAMRYHVLCLSYMTSTKHLLPFSSLSPTDFERLCLWLVRREGYERAEHLGASGGEQGCDIVSALFS
jgi:hypothetical protein